LKFSILIANYNNAHFFVKECYTSIIEQTYRDFEVIIVDDKSTDNSIEVIEAQIKNDERFILYKNDKNKGIGFTKRKLIDLATGDVCAFLDPDDSLSKKALELSIKEYKKNSKIVATYSKLMLCNANLQAVRLHPWSAEIPKNDPYFFNIQNEIHHFFTFRKDIYLQTEGINPIYKIAEDQDNFMKLYEKGEFKFIPEVLYNYRIHNGGISSLTNKMKAKIWFAIVIFEACKRRNIPFDVELVLRDVLNISKIKIQFENTILFRGIFKCYRFLYGK